MKKIILLVMVFSALHEIVSAQDIIKGLTNTASLVPKSQRMPSIRNKDGSTMILSYKPDEGIKVMMVKNGKSFLFCDPFQTTEMVQVGEKDIDGDGKTEILVGNRINDLSIEVKIYKKAEFETEYKQWTVVDGVRSVEFPGDGTVKLYDDKGKVSMLRFNADGKLLETK